VIPPTKRRTDHFLLALPLLVPKMVVPREAVIVVIYPVVPREAVAVVSNPKVPREAAAVPS
jgi:hypothetical protein